MHGCSGGPGWDKPSRVMPHGHVHLNGKKYQTSPKRIATGEGLIRSCILRSRQPSQGHIRTRKEKYVNMELNVYRNRRSEKGPKVALCWLTGRFMTSTRPPEDETGEG